jgi:hypothetical protein
MGATTTHMYLVITTAIWMNKSTDQSKNARNVPFGVFGVMLPYKTVRSTHFSDLCVCIKFNFLNYNYDYFQAKLDTGVCYIIDENGYIMFISQQEGIDRTVCLK